MLTLITEVSTAGTSACIAVTVVAVASASADDAAYNKAPNGLE